MGKAITYLINTSEITAGTRGASLGPGAVMAVARKQEKLTFGEFPLQEVEVHNYMLDHPIKYPHAKRAQGLVKVYKDVASKVKGILDDNRFPLVLAGDHGSAGGTIAGIKAAYPNKRLGVIWIDAHGDLHTPYTTPSGNMHGMPLSTALSEDNIPCKINNVKPDAAELWNQLKNTGVEGQKIQPEDLVFIAVRDVEEQEIALMDRLNIKNYTVAEVNQLGEEEVLNQINTKLQDCDMIYVSFDVDSMDPKVTSHGTGTPVDNGLMPDQAYHFLTKLAVHPKVVCMEFVEVNPCLDEKTNKMAEVTFELFEAVVNELKK